MPQAVGETWDKFPELKFLALKRMYKYMVCLRSLCKGTAGAPVMQHIVHDLQRSNNAARLKALHCLCPMHIDKAYYFHISLDDQLITSYAQAG